MLAAAFVIAATLLTGVTPGSEEVEAASRSCMGVPATAVLTRANRAFQLTPGNDVVYGSSGADVITTASPDDVGGVDLICGNGGDDLIGVVSGEGSRVDGGSGRDIIVVVNGADATGGSGNDRLLLGCGPGTEVHGGSGNDAFAGDVMTAEIEADAAINALGAIGGGDYPCLFGIPAPLNGELTLIMNTFGPQFYALTGSIFFPSIIIFNGATGRGGSGSDAIVGFGGTVLMGDSGSDAVFGWDFAFYGPPGPPASIDCGPGRDFGFAPSGVPTKRCEQTDSYEPSESAG
jgi:hypothetical protein